MNKKKRYFIIFICFLAFLFLAPVMVLYITGTAFDPKEYKFYKTGILSADFLPNDAAVFIDGKLKKKSAGSVKFLKPGKYQVSIEKAGYQPWRKELEIKPGVVTWANPDENKIQLLFQEPKKLMEISVVRSAAFGKNSILILSSENELSLISGTEKSPVAHQDTILAVYPVLEEDEFLLAQASSSLLYIPSQNSFVSGLPADLNGRDMQKMRGGQYLFLERNSLFEFTQESGSSKKLFSDILAFKTHNSSLYYLQASGTEVSLLYRETLFSEPQNIFSVLPNFKNGEIFVNSARQIFVRLDENLYLVSGDQLIQLSDSAELCHMDNNKENLLFKSGPDLKIFPPYSSEAGLLTRTSEKIEAIEIFTRSGGYVTQKNNEIYFSEIDPRDRQNKFLVYRGNQILNILLDPPAKNLSLLDENTFKILKLR